MKPIKIGDQFETEGYGLVEVVEVFTNQHSTRDVYEIRAVDNRQKYLVYKTELQ